MNRINVKDKLDSFSDHWSPKIIAQLNGQDVKLAKIKGEFVWHHHEHEDELFYILNGQMTMELRDRKVVLKAGDMFVVPKGVEHRPVAEEEVHIMLIEPSTTLHTGNVMSDITVSEFEKI